jgi:hypothetical protein
LAWGFPTEQRSLQPGRPSPTLAAVFCTFVQGSAVNLPVF